MLSVTAVIAIAVGCSVLFIVSATVGIVVWWRLRQDRLSLAMAQARLAATVPVQGFNSVLADPARKDAALPYGQLPYSLLPREWAPLASTETFQLSMTPVKRSSSPQKRERARSLRGSISRSLSKRLSLSKRNHQKPVALSPLTVDEATKSSSSNNRPDAKEKEPTSAVEGFSELPTEITPRNTPEKDREDATPSELASSRSACTAWPHLASDRTFTVLTDQHDRPGQRSSRVRTGSIIAQSAGAAPEMPMPPPPPASYARGGIYQLPPDDSLMRLSSLSLETANSSILDEGRRASMSVDGEFHSPSLPPCPTFTPFSPCDIVRGGSVARDCASQRRSQSQRLSSSTARLTVASSDSYKLDLGGCSPRRSLTTRESPQPASDWPGQLPRRGETVLSPPRPRPASRRADSSPRRQTANNAIAKSYASQRQRRTSSVAISDEISPWHAKEPPTTKLGPHLRLSSHHVRRTGFSPMLEEPEEVSELENENDLNVHSSSNQQQQQQQRRHSRHCSTGSIPEIRSSSILGNNCSPAMNSRVVTRSNTSRKRSHSRMDDDVFVCPASASSPSEKHSLSRTPSPEKPEPASWYLPRSDAFSLSPSLFATGSPQRYTVRGGGGPQGVPVRRTVRNSAPPCANTSTSTTGITTTSITRSEDSIMSTPTQSPKRALTLAPSPSKDVRKSITLLRRMNSDAWDDDSRAYRCMGGCCSPSPSPSSLSLSLSLQQGRRMSASNRSSLAGSITIWEDAGEEEDAASASASASTLMPRRRVSVMERIDSDGAAEDAASSSNSSKNNPSSGDNNDSTSDSTTTKNNVNNNSNSSNNNDTNKNNQSILTTPHNKPKGLGLGYAGADGGGGPSCATTPASLYDRDGFLKE
ncbi:hypothetical protein T310_2620 [Rasamsonia emersonii CBS 393.64]|uniref:Uncharacterized protein n=1 Tax=Rasamsonia emersonii (strain ATCC 16479 / CBS 393.64 / IMI 116815) TaxID=1408163 RepID=A0A0F4YZU5_RASE3|nr:hypothetical protein T310_2620 [Rasamsonia emersonii CBS 393.64]KKA23366.1 hypothetical protein T310_2620 [Rasamsonia emersonii CBS 393.64]